MFTPFRDPKYLHKYRRDTGPRNRDEKKNNGGLSIGLKVVHVILERAAVDRSIGTSQRPSQCHWYDGR